MDSAAGHPPAPETMAVAEKRETGRAEVLPAWALPAVPFGPAWEPDEAPTELASPARAGSRAQLW